MKNKNVHAVGGIPIVESRKKSLGIYVHIPFCRSKCEYCDFYSIPGARSKELMTRYLDAVIAHIRESAPCAVGYEVDTVYFATSSKGICSTGAPVITMPSNFRSFSSSKVL